MQPFIPPALSDLDEIVADVAATPWSAPLIAAQQCIGSGGKGLDGLLQASVASALDIIPAASGALVALLADGHLVCRAASGNAAARLGQPLPIDPIIARCLGEGRLVHCQDSARDPGGDGAAWHRRGIASIIVLPLPCAGSQSGILAIHAGDPGAFAARDRLSAQLLAGPIALGLAASPIPPAGPAEDPRLASGFEQAPVGLACIGPAGDILTVNARFCALAGRPRESLTASALRDLLHEADFETQSGLIEALADGTIGHFEMEARCLRPGGTEIWLKLSVSLCRDSRGRPAGFVIAAEDIDARKREAAEEIHDPLTGLLSAKGLSQRLERELDRAANDGKPLTLALVEVDGLDGLQADLGWDAGQDCLRAIGEALEWACRPGDSLARIDDHFVMVVPGLGRSAATATLKRVRAAVARLARDRGWPILCTIGSASRLRDGGTPESLIAAAGRRLAQARAKRGGPGPG